MNMSKNKKKKQIGFKIVLNFLILFNLAFCASTQKKFEETQKKNPQYHYNMGSFYLNNGNVDEAIRSFSRVIALNSNHYLAYNGMGLAYLMKRNFEEAEKNFLKCLALNPSFSEARNNLGTLYQEMGLLDKAEQEFRIAASDRNYNSRELPYYNLARLRLAQGNYREALEFIDQSLSNNSRLAMAHNLKGLILEKIDRLEEAIKSYTTALRILPDDTNINFNLGVAYFKSKDFEKAREIFEKVSPQVTDPEIRSEIEKYLKMIKESPDPKE